MRRFSFGVGLQAGAGLHRCRGQLRTILRYNPKDAEIWLYLGDIAIYQGDELLARECYTRAATVQPEAAETVTEARSRVDLLDSSSRKVSRGRQLSQMVRSPGQRTTSMPVVSKDRFLRTEALAGILASLDDDADMSQLSRVTALKSTSPMCWTMCARRRCWGIAGSSLLTVRTR